MMRRHRAVQTTTDHSHTNDSSSDDDDAFAALSRKEKKKKNSISKKRKNDDTNDITITDIGTANEHIHVVDDTAASSGESPFTSSNQSNTTSQIQQHQQQASSSSKRHHIEVSDERKAKMDAILMELEEEAAAAAAASKQYPPSNSNNHRKQQRRGHQNDDKSSSGGSNIDDATALMSEQQHRSGGGSFVDPGDEEITTNLFVGNLAPSITEEQMTELFRQFGDLYSVKIMWPRTTEERLRNRHTGFVCFMNRQDAEDAMMACNDHDPFRVGRQLMLRWGKNVIRNKSNQHDSGFVPMIYRGTGVTASSILKTTQSTPISNIENQTVANILRADLHSSQESTDNNNNNQSNTLNSIHVILPKDINRATLITTVASFVAKDGVQLEQLLLQNVSENPQLTFLSLPIAPKSNNDATNYDVLREEHIFYRWRVYAFCQGDGLYTWRTEPFVMIQDGCLWYPPPLDIDAAQREVEETNRKEDAIRKLKDQRRYQNTKRNIISGRQLERSKKSGASSNSNTELSDLELEEFDKLFVLQLCISRESICQAMAFCFEKSHAAKQISQMIHNLLVQQLLPGISFETISARMYLISDILFNTQQPGIRNAFLYRDSIEKLGPELFTKLGDFVRTNFGRLSQERVTSTISSIISAWTNWGVFDPTYLNDLMAKFDGRSITDATTNDNTEIGLDEQTETDQDVSKIVESKEIDDIPKGDWTSVSVHEEYNDIPSTTGNILNDCQPKTASSVDRNTENSINDDDPDGVLLDDGNANPNGKVVADDPGGEPLDDDNIDPDGEPLEDDPDGEPLEDDPDGEPLEEDPDGEPLEDDPDGEPLEDDPDGEPLDDNDIDGAPL